MNAQHWFLGYMADVGACEFEVPAEMRKHRVLRRTLADLAADGLSEDVSTRRVNMCALRQWAEA